MAFVPPLAVGDASAEKGPPPLRSCRLTPGAVGQLHLNGCPVGSVTVTGWDTSWGFGRFQPDAADFAPYADAYGLWALLMHRDDAADGRLSRAASAELAQAENQLDRIRARLYFPNDDVWLDVFEVNIDGDLVEWKEY